MDRDFAVRLSAAQPMSSMLFDPVQAHERWPGIPEGVLQGMARYFNGHVRAGSFLTACLENDLVGAFETADPFSLEALPNIVRALVNDAPAVAWGSPLAVREWLEARDKANSLKGEHRG